MYSLYERICKPAKMCRRVGALGALPTGREVIRRTARVALPSIAEALLIAVVGMVDTYMVSGLGDYAISAVGLTTQPKFVSLAPFLALNIAISALVARRRGEGRMGEAGKVLQQAMMVSLALCAALTCAAWFAAEPAIALMGSQADTHTAATGYFRIISAGMVFNVVTMVINAAQRGAGNTKIAMKTNLVANLVNVALNYLLIEGNFGFPRLETDGAAIATMIGTAVAMGMAIASVSGKHAQIHLFRGFKLRLEKAVMASLLKLGLPTLAEQLCVRVGFIMFFALVANLGTTANAAHHIGMNFMSLSFSLADGLSVAAVALVGRSLGEKRKDMALVYSSTCQRFGVCFSVLLFAIYVPFGRTLYSLFSNNPEVQAYGSQLMPVLAVVVFIQITMIIFMSCLRAAGDVRYVALVGLLSIGIIRPAGAYLLCYAAGMGLLGAWLGMLIDQMMRLLLSYLRYKKGKWLDIKI